MHNRPQFLTDILIAAETGNHASMVNLLRQSKIGKVEIEDVVRIIFLLFKGSLQSLSSKLAVLYDYMFLLRHKPLSFLRVFTLRGDIVLAAR